MKQILFNKYSNRFLSRWLVLAIDLFIVLFSIVFSTLLRRNFSIGEINMDLLQFNLKVLISIRVLTFLLFHTYKGIVRHTSIEDAKLILKVVFLGTLLSALISLSYRYSFDFYEFSYDTLAVFIIDFLVSSFLMVTLRYFVKSMYESIMGEFKAPVGVLIYGAGYSGLLTKNVVQSNRGINYQVMGFIDDNDSLVNKTLEGIMVYSLPDAMQKFVGEYEGLEVIMAINRISTSAKRKISDTFLDKGVIVKTLPPVDKWVDGGFEFGQIHHVKIEDLLGRDVIQMDNPRISEEINGTVVMVTGAAGSIGSEIVRQLIAYLPAKIILVDQSETGLFDLEFELMDVVPTHMQVSIYVSSVCDELRMSRIFKTHKPSFVFHAAAYKHVPLMENNPYEAVKTNVLGTKIIADLAAKNNVRKFVMVSTDKAVNPTNVMGATKRLAEMYTQSLNQLEGVQTKFIATRFGNVLGSNGSVIPLFKKQIERGGPLTVTHPEITRYFMTIPESCELVLEAATMGEGGEVFVFDMGQSVKIVDLAKKMITLSGLRIDKDISIKFTGLRPGEKLFEELLNDNENTMQTHHKKILIARVNTPSYDYMENHLTDLASLLDLGINNHIVAKIKEIIPEYRSNNSVFETLDKTRITVKK
jgi:FlaA1/EpsC-like NDP-sugar epimerase